MAEDGEETIATMVHKYSHESLASVHSVGRMRPCFFLGQKLRLAGSTIREEWSSLFLA